MADFRFIENKLNGKWVISAPRRSKRTNVGKKTSVCPFCEGHEVKEEELYRVPGKNDGWQVRVISNKFPFAPFHEIIVHSPDHHKNWDELPQSSVELILKTYRQRFNTHKKQGKVYIFHNFGNASGASLDHPHTQLVVIPSEVKPNITPMDMGIYKKPFGLFGHKSPKTEENMLETDHFMIFCPENSRWPDEVWIAPKRQGDSFGSITDLEITDLGFALSRLIQIFDTRHGHEFPYNFYISPEKNWYLRLFPRIKVAGGFELGTNIVVNTQDPSETFEFISEHFWKPDHNKIKLEHLADYAKKA